MQDRRSLHPTLIGPIAKIEQLVHSRNSIRANIMAKQNKPPKQMKDYFMLNQYQPSFYVQAPQNQDI